MVVPPPIATPCTAVDQWLGESDQRIYQASLRTIARSRRILREVLKIIPGGERVTGAVQQHDIYVVVLVCFVKQISQTGIHRHRHRILLRRAIKLHSQNASGAF